MSNDEVSLIVNGRRYQGWKSVRVPTQSRIRGKAPL